VLQFWLDKGVDGFRIDAITHMYETNVDAEGRLYDEPVSGTTDDPADYGYLKHIYTTDMEETLELVYDWRSFLDAYKVTNGGDTM
jgi:alpha-glucosidase